MDKFMINGGRRLKGTVTVSGSKNAALPIMAASILAEGEATLHGVPDLADIRVDGELLGDLGVGVARARKGRCSSRWTTSATATPRYDLVRKMRASICVLGPLLAKRGRPAWPCPAAAPSAPRPVDLHLRGLAALGARARPGRRRHRRHVPRSSSGAEIFLGGPFGSHRAGHGQRHDGRRPGRGHDRDRVGRLRAGGAGPGRLPQRHGRTISGAGTPRIVIQGVEELTGPSTRSFPTASRPARS